ncbi:MAG: MFS transporter [Oscillospiraceae bacterium]|jgi:Na+/melibiose symporter-like transporter|nr:MFS transporter [Oscillospiraceae bacterium]
MATEVVQTAHRRRYVSGRETMAYVLFDSSKNFHINEFQTRFVVDVLKIDLGWNSILSLINGIWDVINDGFLGALVDKTNTRWGKFRPYLLAYAGPGTLFISLYWMAPLFFDKNPLNAGKIIFWLALAMLLETFSTVRELAETGLLANLTPSPDDRVRLYTQAEVISSIWESIPQITMGLLIDMVNHKMVSFSLQSAFVGMGTFCAAAGGVLAIFFAVFSRERIAQSPEKHNYREGLKTILRNRPMLLIMISEFLGGFSVTTWEHNYYIDVLGSESLRNVVTIPGAPLSFLSYTYINKVRARFPIKSLWIFGQHLKDVCSLGIFLLGSVGGRGAKGLYQNRWLMVGLLMFRDICYKGTLSINKIIPKEILLDALDYCEWKNGFRSEGVTLATKSMAAKIVRNIINSFTTLIMKVTGYSLNAGFGNQSDRAKYALFTMSLLIPAVTGFLAILPKLFYDLSGQKREQMYAELAEMRTARQEIYNEAG